MRSTRRRAWGCSLTELVRSARGGHSYKSLIDSPRKAEEIAAAWLRRFGYRDALVTPVGPDDGVDAGSFGAVAHGKWTGRPVSAPDVRRLAGTGKPGQARFLFSKSGYTKPALRWAADPERTVKLFIMGTMETSLLVTTALSVRCGTRLLMYLWPPESQHLAGCPGSPSLAARSRSWTLSSSLTRVCGSFLTARCCWGCCSASWRWRWQQSSFSFPSRDSGRPA